jgi:hypothetical protein
MTQTGLKEVLTYDPCSGKFFWNTDMINGSKKGSEAGTLSRKGYIHITINQKQYKAHRLAWLYVYGSFPKNQIDHINQIKSDNWIENLREASNKSNHKNIPLQKNNKSGVHGVGYHKATNKWGACIKVDGKLIHLGLYPEIDLAIKARKEAEVKYQFHKNHGNKRPVSG